MQFSSTWRADFIRPIILPFLFFTFTSSLLPYASSSPAIFEKSVLLEFKSSVSDLSGILSTNSSDYLEHCSWYGVVCGLNSRVSALDIDVRGKRQELAGNLEKVSYVDVFQFPFYDLGVRRTNSIGNGRLIGALPFVIVGLTEIRVLSLPFHELGGEIPAQIWDLQNLEVLNLQDNSFNGSLPISFEGLRKFRGF